MPHWRLTATAIVVCLCCATFLGFNDTVFNIPAEVIRKFLRESFSQRFGRDPVTWEATILWSATMAAYGIGLISGGVAVAFLADRMERRIMVLFIGGALSIVGHVLCSAAYFANSFELLILGRFMVGFEGCAALGLINLWLIECSPPQDRGFIGAMSNSFEALGTLVAQVAALPQLLGGKCTWPYLLGLGAVAAVLRIVIAPCLHSSPKFLYLKKHNKAKAEAAIRFYYGPDANTDEVIASYDREQAVTAFDRDSMQRITMSDIWNHKPYLMPILIVLVSNALPATLGWFVFDTYSTTVLEHYNVGTFEADAVTTAMMSVSVVGALLAPVVISAISRRSLMLGSACIMFLMNVGIFMCILFYVTVTTTRWPMDIVIILLLVLALVYNLGVGALPLILAVELCPQELRNVTSSLAVTTCHVGVFVSQTFFYAIFLQAGVWSFLIFPVLSLPAIIALSEMQPESKDRPTREIIRDWLPEGDDDRDFLVDNQVSPAVESGEETLPQA